MREAAGERVGITERVATFKTVVARESIRRTHGVYTRPEVARTRAAFVVVVAGEVVGQAHAESARVCQGITHAGATFEVVHAERAVGRAREAAGERVEVAEAVATFEVGHAEGSVGEASAESTCVRVEVAVEAAALRRIVAERAVGLAHGEPTRLAELIAESRATLRVGGAIGPVGFAISAAANAVFTLFRTAIIGEETRRSIHAAHLEVANSARTLTRTTLERRDARSTVGKTHPRSAHSIRARSRAAIHRVLTDEPILLTRRSANVVVTVPATTLGIRETSSSLWLACTRSAESIGAQTVATFAAVRTSRALRFALISAAKSVETIEVATLFRERAREARGRTRKTSAESIDTIEVAAVDRDGAGRTLRRTNLLGFAEAVVALETGAALVRSGTCFAEFPACGLAWSTKDVVVVAASRSARSESEHEGRDEHAKRSDARGERRTHVVECRGRSSKAKLRALAKMHPWGMIGLA